MFVCVPDARPAIRRHDGPLIMRTQTGKRITIIQGHPDPKEAHFCHELAWAYDEGASAAGHEMRSVDVSKLEFSLIANQREFRAHGLERLESGILSLSGIAPIRASLIGSIEQGGATYRAKWLEKIRRLGAEGR